MLAVDVTRIVLAGGVVAALVIALVGAWYSRAAYGEVKTMNELSVGQLGAAAESRRIGRVPLADRTAQERRHVEGQAEERQVGTSAELPESPEVPPAS